MDYQEEIGERKGSKIETRFTITTKEGRAKSTSISQKELKEQAKEELKK